MARPAKLHLPFPLWPAADKMLWQQTESEDPFLGGRDALLSPASKIRYFTGWRRFLGFLATRELHALEIPPADRLTVERVKSFAKHLAETCSPASVATGVEATYHAARIMMPEVDLKWLRALKTRLHAALPPKPERRVITSVQLLTLGQKLMDEVRPKLGQQLRLNDAVQFRDGLMIALTAFAPVRSKNLAALDLTRHLSFTEDGGAIIIPRAETKTATPLEFEVPSLLMPYLRDYLTSVRLRLCRKDGCTAFWLSPRGKALSQSGIGHIFARHSARRLGFRVRPHDVRAAAATTWAIWSPDQIGVAQELLAHRDERTTTKHYNRARGIQASRAYSQALKSLRRRNVVRR